MTTATQLEPHTIRAEDAAQILLWFKERGGIAIWRTINLSEPGKSWTCPLNDTKGERKTKPCGYAASEPERIITDTDEVLVSKDHEVKRFHVGVERHGMRIKVTDGGSRRIRAAVEKAGEGAYHIFDYETQDAVIMAPADTPITLTEWAKKGENPT